MKTLLASLLCGLTGCAAIPTTGDLAIDVREATWRAMVRQMELDIRHVQELRALGLEAEAALVPNQ